MNKFFVALSCSLLFADNALSMAFDRASRDMGEQIDTQMAKLIDTVIYEQTIPDEARIESVASDCYNAHQCNYQAAFLAFAYQIPEEVPQASSESLKILTNIFDEKLFRLSVQN